MVGGIILIFITGIAAFFLINLLKARHPFLSVGLMRSLFFYHLVLAFVYYLYALFNPSDSIGYYRNIITGYRGEDWFSFYGTSTTFIEFVGYPFVRLFGFSYEAMMVMFAFFGFVGFLYLYIFIRENIRFKHTFLQVDLVTLIFFLPNLHFWSSSFGKGSIILMGIGLFFYGITRIRARWIELILGGIIIYHVRPHIMLMILISSAIGFMFTTKGVSFAVRLLFLAGVGVAFYFIYADTLKMVGIDEQAFLTQGLDLTHRASELTKASSGVDISSYSLPLQIFTFLYRPLFFDAPGALGLVVSIENVFYLLITLKIFNLRGIRYMITSNFLVKTAFFSFLTVSIALAQIAGNLGLAIRQKSQIMLLFLFVILSFLDKQKLTAYQQAMLNRMRRTRAANIGQEKEKAV